MTEAGIVAYFGVFLTCWAAGFALSWKILQFKKMAEEIT